ncbi:uncharacterized protein [Nicotiana sylvestris]|uniref:uncharacterized protein n=1 Tax=Nicotiana sylvestris TaxID=4096 RepID=UPI00388C8562
MCKMSTNENEPFAALEEIPLQLHMWWNDLGKVSRGTVVKVLGGLVGLLKIKPRLDVIEALIPFWDPTHNVFHFSDFELTPTLEEIVGYAGLSGNLRSRYSVSPRTVSPHKFLDMLSISREVQDGNLSEGFCTFQFLYQRYGNKDKWEARGDLAFIVAFLGVIICPRKDGNIELGLMGMVDVMIKKANGTLVPMILAEIYRTLTICREGGRFFQGCNLLLQLWIQEHLCHHVGYMNYVMTGLNCIEEYENRVVSVEFPEGGWFCGNLASHPYFTRSKGSVEMSSESHLPTIPIPEDSPILAIPTSESATAEENRTLRLRMGQRQRTTKNSLSNLKKKSSESFRVYVVKWCEQAARVKPPMDETEMVSVFLQAQEADYYQNMMSAMGKTFAEAIKIGEMVENYLKTGRILSQFTIKATSHAIQGGSEGVENQKKK